MATVEERLTALEASVVGLTAQLVALPTIQATLDASVANQSVVAQSVVALSDRIDQQVVPVADDAIGRAQVALDKAVALEARADTLESASADHESRITVLENPTP